MRRGSPRGQWVRLSHWFQEFKTYAREEFVAHLPFTFLGLFAGLGIVLITNFIPFSVVFGEGEFHLAHYTHVFFSAAAGAAIFRTYQDSVIKAVPVAFFSSVSLCTLSDSLIPYLGFWLFKQNIVLHLCLFEHPLLVSLSSLFGIVLGFIGIRFFRHCNRNFHLLHILISTVASVLYMISFTGPMSLYSLFIISVSLFFSLAIPCLVADVTLPLCFVNIQEERLHERTHHS